jgi:hypothetical protein
MRAFANANYVSGIVRSCLVMTGSILLCFSLICLCQGCSEKESPVSQTSDTVIEQWTDVAREENMAEAVIRNVGALMERTLSAHGLMATTVTHPDIRDSLRRFITEFRHAFTSPQDGSSFSYYFVWLVAEAIKRGQNDKAALEKARTDFRQCIEMLDVRLRADFREQLGVDFVDKYEKQIETGIDWTKNALMRQFKVLQADPLFPSFKGPLGRDVLEAAVENASRPEEYEHE